MTLLNLRMWTDNSDHYKVRGNLAAKDEIHFYEEMTVPEVEKLSRNNLCDPFQSVKCFVHSSETPVGFSRIL